MSAAPNFLLVTDLSTLHRRDFPLTSEAIASPLDSRPLVDGEWLYLDSNYKLARGGDNNSGTADEDTSPNVFPVHTEKGRYDVQALKKANVLMLGMYEAETTICAPSLSLGDVLTVQDVSLGGVVRRALAAEGVTAGRVVVGYVSKVISTTKVRFVHFGNFKR